MKDETFIVVFAGGGSGGHVYPTLAVIEALQKKMTELKVNTRLIRIGPKDGYETLFGNLGLEVQHIASGKLRRYFSLLNIIDVPKFFIGLLQSLFKLYFIMPDLVFSKGGTGAFPVVLAAWFYRIPIAIHESDSEPGLTNLFSSAFAKKIFVSFPVAAARFNARKTELTGAPLRTELLAAPVTKETAKEALGFTATIPLILILGGSQGSARINEFILAHLSDIVKETQVLHQTGLANLAEAQKLSRAALIDGAVTNRYTATGYFDKNLNIALSAADIVISRAGSSTIFEIAAFGAPAILIPLAGSANGHQRTNAYEFSKGGGGIVIEESNLLPGIFFSELKRVLSDPALQAKMATASKAFFTPGAAEKIAEELVALAAN